MPNAVVQKFRERFPDSPESDEEITIRLFDIDSARPQPIYTDPDFRREALEIKRLTLTPGDYAAQAIGSAGRGVVGGFASIPKSMEVLTKQGERLTGIPPYAFPSISPALGLASTLLGKQPSEVIQSAGESVLPEPREGLEDSFWATQIPETIGGLTPMVVGGIAGAPLKLGRVVPALIGQKAALRAGTMLGARAATAEALPAAAEATLGATIGATGAGMMQQAVAGYEDAKRHGASEADAFKSYLLNGGITLSEIVPVASVLSRLDRLSGGTFKKALINAGKDSLSEALQEAFQGYAGNKIANTIVAYDPARKDFDGLIEQAGAGGVVGALMSLALHGIGGHTARIKENGIASTKAEPKTKEAIQESAAIAPYTRDLTDDRKQYLFAWKQRELQGALTDEDINAARTFEDNEKAYLVDGQVEANAREDLKQQAKKEGEKYEKSNIEEASDEGSIETGIREQAGTPANQDTVQEVIPANAAPGMSPEDAALLQQVIDEQRTRLQDEQDVIARARAMAAAVEPGEDELEYDGGEMPSTPGTPFPVAPPAKTPVPVPVPPPVPVPAPTPPTAQPAQAQEAKLAAEHPLIASIDFAGGYTKDIGHPVELDMGEPKRLGNRARISGRLVDGGRGSEDNPKLTKRVTFFKDTDKDSKTFGQVVALNTYRRVDGTVIVENPKGGNIGIDIIKLPSKFEPVMSLRMNKAEKRAPVWFSEDEFEAVRLEATTRYSASRAGTEAFIEGAQTGFRDAEGNIIETAPADASTSPEREDRDHFADLIVDSLPKSQDGKSIAKNLTIDDMDEVVLSAFGSVDNADDAKAWDFAFKQALEVASKDSRFKSASNLEKQEMLRKVIAHEIYAVYKKGNFATQTPSLGLFAIQAVQGETGAVVQDGGVQPGMAGVPGELGDESTRYSYRFASASPFYSRITRTVEDSPQAKASGAQWKATIRNSKLGINKDEYSLVSVEDLEDGKTYTKQEVLDYLKANEVVVKDVTLADRVGRRDVRAEGLTAVRDTENPNFWHVFNKGVFFDAMTASSSEDAIAKASEAIFTKEQQTHFSTYQLPGAKEGPLARDTELLTNTGWRRIDALKIGDVVLTRKDSDGGLEWNPVEDMPTIHAPELLYFKNRSVDLQVTPGHTMVVWRPLLNTPKIQRLRADELWNAPHDRLIPLTGSGVVDGDTALFGLNGRDVGEFLGWFIAEGCCRKQRSGNKTPLISQSETANPAKCRRIEALLQRLGIEWGRSRDGYNLRSKTIPPQLLEVLRQQPLAHHKYIPKFIFSCPKRVIEGLIDGLILGDGTTHHFGGNKNPQTRFFSCSRQLVEDFQAALVLTGKTGVISTTTKSDGRILYVVGVKGNHFTKAVGCKHSIVEYNDTAFCVTVKNHAICVRRNGLVSFTGNSYREVLLTVPMEQAQGRKIGDDLHWRDGHSQYSEIANPIVRLRLNERTTADGKRMLFLEEVQAPQKFQFDRMPALFQKNWREIAFKWALNHAVENGFDSVGWTTGEQQAERYDLSKQVSSLVVTESSYDNDGVGIYSIYAGKLSDSENMQRIALDVPKEKLGDFIGKDLASKITGAEPRYEFSGLNLKIGGDGLKKLYDSDFRNVVNGLPSVKKAGKKVGQETILTGKHGLFPVFNSTSERWDVVYSDGRILRVDGDFGSQNEALLYIEKASPLNSENIHSLSITPAIRESVLGGQALFRQPTTEADIAAYRVRNDRVTKLFWDNLAAFGAAGADVRMIQAAFDAQGGVFSQKNGIVLAMHDLNNPSLGNLFDLLHEPIHKVFAGLSPQQQAWIHQAVESLKLQWALNPSISPNVPVAKRADVVSEERAVEDLTQNLAAQGFNAAESRGIAQALWRAIKDAYFRAAMWIQEGMFGKGNASPELARAWFENRVKAALSGDPRPMSFISFLGGPKLRPNQVVEAMTPATGLGHVPHYDPDIGAWITPDLLPDSMDAVDATIRYRWLNTTADEKPVMENSAAVGDQRRNVAGLNVVDNALREAWDHFNSRGLNQLPSGGQLPGGGPILIYPTYEDWVRQFIASNELRSLPSERIAKINQSLAAKNLPPIPTDLRYDQMTSEDGGLQGATFGYGLLRPVRIGLEKVKNEAESVLNGIQTKIDRANNKLQRLWQHYTSKDLIASNTKAELAQSIKNANSDFRQALQLTRKESTLSQVLRQLDKKALDPLYMSRQYEGIINRMYREFTGDTSALNSFVDVLEAIATYPLPAGVDWRNSTVSDLRDALLLDTNPITERLRDRDANGDLTSEAVSLMGMAISFAKHDYSTMLFLQLSKLNTEQGRTHVNNALQAALGGAKDSINRARTLVDSKRYPRAFAIAQRLLDEYQKTFNLHASLQAERERLILFESTHRLIIEPVMEKHFGEMDRVLGATTVAWYPSQGENYSQPPTDTATMAETLENKKEIKLARDGRLAQEIRDDLKSKQAWLDSIPIDKRDKNWNDLNDQVIKMANIEIDYEHNTLTQGRISRMSGIITNQLDGTGVPALQEVARMLRNYTAWMDADKHPVRAASIEWSALEYKLIKSLKKYDRHKLSQSQERHSILDPAKKFIADNAALYEEITDVDRADTEMFRRLRDKANEIMPSGLMTDQSWKALAALIKKDREIGQMFMAISMKRGNKIEDPVLGIHRKPVGQRLGIFPQMLSDYSTLMYDSMRAKWGKQVVSNKWVLNQWVPDKEALGKVANGYSAKYTQDPNALRAELAPFYTADVWNGFVKDIVERDTGAFDAPAALDGLKLGAGRHNVMRAWRESGGDVVTFAERLGDLEGAAPAKKSAFVGETISTFNAFWSSLQNQKMEQADSQSISLANLSHFLLDSRKAEEYPAPWMQYQTYTQPEAQSKLTKILEHAAYGRDAKAALTNFQKAITELEELAVRYNALSSNIPKGPNYRAEQKRIFAPLGGLKLYEDAERNLQIAENSKSHFESLLKSQSTVMTDFGALAEFFHFAPFAAVQGIGTVLTDTIAPTKWIQKYGFSTQALQAMTGNYAKFGYNLWGGIMNSFSRQYTLVSENVQRYNRMGYVQSEQQIKLGGKLRAITNAAQVPVSGRPTDYLGRYVKIGVRGLKTILSHPVGYRSGLANPQFAPFTPGSLFGWETVNAHASSTQQSWSVFENLVLRAVEFFNQPQNAHLLDDTTFRLDASHLGYKKYFFGVVDDVSAFKHMVSDLAKRGMTLERLAKEAIERRRLNLPNTPLLSDKAYQLIGQIGPSEITMDGNVTSRPWWMLNSPSGSFFTPLLGWSWAQADSVPRALREPNGEATLKAFQRGMVAFAAIAPIAIAYAVMRQWYDEYGLGKKQNVLDFAQVKNPVDALKIVMDMVARVGTLGLGGEAINSVLNSQTNRDFTLDNRIFFMSSLLSIKRAVETWARQGAEGTWQTVYRPLFQGVGGSGYLQYADLLNNAMSLDNQESRVVARINVGNYLRTAGRGLGWDVRTSKAQSTAASASHAWISEMLLSALADDPVTFREARMKAVAASKEEGYPDAEDHVKRSFTSMNPLKTPFQTTKSAAEYRKLINSMNGNGQEAVRSAVRNYNRYAERIGIKPFEGKQPKPEAGLGSFNRNFGGDFSAARMRATLGLQRDSMFSPANY